MLKVAQCWDDGVATDINLISILKKYKAKATFNLCPGIMNDQRIEPCWNTFSDGCWDHKGFNAGRVGKKELVDIYCDFQVASHCMHHETVGRVPDDVFLKNAIEARKILEDTFQRECLGFAWPCGKYSPETIQAMHDAGFAYGRTTLNTDDVTAYKDPMTLDSSCHYQAPDFLQRYKDAKKTGVFYFWGHSYEMLNYDKLYDQLEQKIAYISADPDSEWVDVIDIVK